MQRSLLQISRRLPKSFGPASSHFFVYTQVMGLNGRKLKQRIGNDPRNLTWVDDASRFGVNYLAKFGWDSSKGLGASGEGRKSHLGVSKKLDMLGIGAAHQHDPNGIAWKQNKDFENLLKRLNEDAEASVGGFMKADSDGMDSVGQEKNGVHDEGKKEKRKRKDDSKGSPKKKKKIEKEGDEEESTCLPSERETGNSERRQAVPTLPRHRAHRARAIAAKNLSSKSAAHISEILGIVPTHSGLTSGTDTPQPQDVESYEIERITTSTKSVHDYFKEKLKSKKPSTFVSPLERDLSHDTPRGGLGSTSRTSFGSSTPSSTFLVTASQSIPNITSSDTEVTVEARVAGISATLDMENNVKRKKRSRVKHGEALVSDDNDVRVDVGECHSKRTIDQEDKPDNILAYRLTTKKKTGRRKKDKHIRD